MRTIDLDYTVHALMLLTKNNLLKNGNFFKNLYGFDLLKEQIQNSH